MEAHMEDERPWRKERMVLEIPGSSVGAGLVS